MILVEISFGVYYIFIFDRIWINVGFGYNNNIGVFIVLREGIYVFMWVIRMVIVEYLIELLINDDIFGVIFLWVKNGDDGFVSGIVVVYVIRGDVVFVCIYFFYVGDGNIYSNVYG